MHHDPEVIVRRAGLADADAIAAVLADAFADYAWTRWTVAADGHVSRVEELQRLVLVEVALPHGEVWLAERAGVVLSAAIWNPPDGVPPSVWDRIAASTAMLEGDRHAYALAAARAVEPFRPQTPHYFLGAVGTASAHERQGLAARVLAPTLARADTTETDAYLETSSADNVRFYERLGFTVSGETDVPDGGPHVWAMSRAPQR